MDPTSRTSTCLSTVHTTSKFMNRPNRHSRSVAFRCLLRLSLLRPRFHLTWKCMLLRQCRWNDYKGVLATAVSQVIEDDASPHRFLGLKNSGTALSVCKLSCKVKEQVQEGHEKDGPLIFDRRENGPHEMFDRHPNALSTGVVIYVRGWSEHIYRSDSHFFCCRSIHHYSRLLVDSGFVTATTLTARVSSSFHYTCWAAAVKGSTTRRRQRGQDVKDYSARPFSNPERDRRCRKFINRHVQQSGSDTFFSLCLWLRQPLSDFFCWIQAIW